MKRRALLTRVPKTLRKPWNASTLLMAIVAMVLMLLAVFSVRTEPSRTGDYLEFTHNQNKSILHRDRQELDLYQRNIQIPVQSSDHGKVSTEVEPMQIKIGIYATNNYKIEPNTPSFDSVGYIWFKWQDDLQEYFLANELDVWKVMTPVNLLDIPESSDSVFTPTSEPMRMKVVVGI